MSTDFARTFTISIGQVLVLKEHDCDGPMLSYFFDLPDGRRIRQEARFNPTRKGMALREQMFEITDEGKLEQIIVPIYTHMAAPASGRVN